MLQFHVGKAEDVVGLVGRREVMSIETLPALRPTRAPWNKGRRLGGTSSPWVSSNLHRCRRSNPVRRPALRYRRAVRRRNGRWSIESVSVDVFRWAKRNVRTWTGGPLRCERCHFRSKDLRPGPAALGSEAPGAARVGSWIGILGCLPCFGASTALPSAKGSKPPCSGAAWAA